MSTFELLQVEAQAHVLALSNGMLALEQQPAAVEQVETCVRAARSLRTVARIAGWRASADLARAMEDCLSAVHRGQIELRQEHIDLIFRAVDLIDDLAKARYKWPFLVEPPLVSPAKAADEAAPSAFGKVKRVLVIDDSLAIRELERSLLSAHGYAVEVAVDGLDGWNMIRAGSFDLVLADDDMPVVDGMRLLRLIRKEPRLQALPVVIAFDQGNETAKRRAFEAGADYYIIKNGLRDNLTDTVASLIGS